MSPRRRPPTPAELAETPELAILEALDNILDLALRTLVSAHPQLADPECPAWLRDTSPARVAVDRILSAATPLATALEDYRRAVTPRREQEPETDPTF